MCPQKKMVGRIKMNIHKNIHEVMNKTLVALLASKAKYQRLMESAVNVDKMSINAKCALYLNIGKTTLDIQRLERYYLTQQYHSNKVKLLEFITFPIAVMIKVFKWFGLFGIK